MTVEGEIVLTEDQSSGRVHRRVMLGGAVASLEGCNLDQAGAYEVIPSIDGIKMSNLCQRCFPNEQGSGLD